MSQPRNIFTGVVITSKAGSRAVVVARESYGSSNTGEMGNLIEGVVVASVVSSFLGFKDCTLPQPGARVLCVEDSAISCFVIGSIPQASLEVEAMPSRSTLGQGCALDDKANRIGHEAHLRSMCDLRRPTDLVDGEYSVGNELGVLLGLYQQLAVLKASELAQVQCFLLDDLVRIISHNFQHYTALGEYNIYHDGKRLMAEFGATHKVAESYGSPAVESDKGSLKTFDKTGKHKPDDSDDFYELVQDERMKAVERFKMFLGSVGDFLQLFLVRPNPESPRVLNGDVKEETTETGLWNLHVGTDGGMHMRSVKEVFIEKTNWIRVPVRQYAPDDPEGDDAQKLDYTPKKPFEFNRDFNYKGNPFAYALQIRDYLAYINEKENYQNFSTHEKDFFVSKDVDKEEHVGKFGKVDQETTSTVNQYQLKTAGIYLMPNGGITIRDTWNSSIVMEGGNIYIQPAKDLVMQPLRNTVVKAGGFINMACKYHLDLSSSDEGLRIKTDKSQYFYSDNGGVVVEANGSQDTPGSPSPIEEAIDYVGGIVLKSKLSIYRYAENDILDYTKRQLLLQSIGTIDVVANQTATVYGKQNLHLFSDGMLLGMAQNTLVIAEGGAMMAGAGSTVLGQKDQNLGVKYDEKSTFVDVIKGVLDTATLTTSLGKAKEDKQDIINKTTFEFEANFDALTFKFLKSNKYKVSKEQDAIPMTIAQQDAQVTELYNLTEWEEKEVNSTLPYPGAEMFPEFYCASEGIVNLEKKEVSKDYTNMPSPDNKPGEIKLESLFSYKVQI
jgi:hypothetical protein